jgi:methionine synthase II (cobalamin-independent)
VPEAIYPDMRDFYRDLGQTYRLAVRAFADAGCRYLQFDEVNLAYLCDPSLRAQVAGRGEDPEKLPMIYAGMINAAISDVPSDMTIAMHLCRGNFQSTFVASGGYEPVAEILFNAIKVHAYFMEYDSDRAGGFEPLRFVPKGKIVVLGLVTSKSGRLECRDVLKRRIDAATKYVPLHNCVCRRNAASLPPRREPSRRGRAVGEVADDCGTGRRGLGQLACIDPFISAKRNPKNAGSPLPRGRTAEEEGRMSPRNKPPFRADHVGSLLRPAALKKAREQRARGEISPPDQTELEDREIERIIRKQEEVGLQSITDGEFRRSWWHLDFLWASTASRNM